MWLDLIVCTSVPISLPGVPVERRPLVVGPLDGVLDVVGVAVALAVDVLVGVGAGVAASGRRHGGGLRRGDGEEAEEGLKCRTVFSPFLHQHFTQMGVHFECHYLFYHSA